MDTYLAPLPYPFLLFFSNIFFYTFAKHFTFSALPILGKLLRAGNMQLDNIDETIRRISTHPGVLAVIVTDLEGIPLRTTIDQTSTVLYVSRMMSLYQRCKIGMRECDPSNELELVRIRSKRHEILASMTVDYMLLVIQNPQIRSSS